MKKVIERYNAPTPSWARKVGGAMFLAGNFLTGNALLASNPVLGTIGMGLTLGSKVMNLFTEPKAN